MISALGLMQPAQHGGTVGHLMRRLPVPVLDGIWTDLVPDAREPTHARFRALKKTDKVKLLHRLFNEADFRETVGLDRNQNAVIDAWLPPELQWPEIDQPQADDDAGDADEDEDEDGDDWGGEAADDPDDPDLRPTLESLPDQAA